MNTKVFLAALGAGIMAFTGCGGVVEGEELDSAGLVYEEGDAHQSSEESADQVSAMACLSSYDARITAARNWLASNCGSISACGSGDTSTHTDIKLSNGAYCTCHSKMWNVRNSYPFDGLQVIYHEPSACSWNHIHLQVKNASTTTCVDVHGGAGIPHLRHHAVQGLLAQAG